MLKIGRSVTGVVFRGILAPKESLSVTVRPPWIRMATVPTRNRSSGRLLQAKAEQNKSASLIHSQEKQNRHNGQERDHQVFVSHTRQKRKHSTGTSKQDESQPHKTASKKSKTSKSVPVAKASSKAKKSTVSSQSNQSSPSSNHDAKPSTTDTRSSQNAHSKSDKELVDKYNKRLEDLKKKNVISTTKVFQILCDRFEGLRDETRAAAMSKYMRNKFEFFGIPSPSRRAAYADLWEDVKKLNSSDLRTLALQTWYSPEREFQAFTVELLEKEKFRMYDDLQKPPGEVALKTLDFIKTFLACPRSWWDTLDALSSNVVGPLVCKYPDDLLPVMDKWNEDSCFWLARTSLLYQLTYKKDTDANRLFRYCLNLADQEEFFIRKAIGWSLRQYHKTDPMAVRDFVKKHKSKLSNLSVKEALKHDK